MNARPSRLLPLVVFALAFFASSVSALLSAPAVPAAPARHFNDPDGFIPADHARAFDARLAQFERDTSNQLLVVIYPRLPDGAALEDYTVRAAHAWGVGQKDRDNGAVLFVFAADRLLRIEVGYGLEGTLTDAVSHAIIENELKPRLRAGDPVGAFDAAITAMIAATSGEYRGAGRTHREAIGGSRSSSSSSGGSLFVMIVFIVLAVIFGSNGSRGHTYGSPYQRRRYRGGFWGGGSGGGRSSGRGGGGFSGGGGGFGGGGASGRW